MRRSQDRNIVPIQANMVVGDRLSEEKNMVAGDRLSEEENICCICQDCISDHKTKYVIPECKHNFHSNCIIEWFRSGATTCPYCRSSQNPEDRIYRYSRLWDSRYAFVTSFARRKSAPKQLKKLVEKKKKYRTKYSECSKRIISWKKTNKNIMLKRSRLYNLMRQARRSLRRVESDICNYPIVPAVIRN